MGQEQSKQHEQITKNYTIVRTIVPGQYWVRKKKKGEELLLRILTFYVEDEMVQYLKLLDKRKKIKNKHLLELIQHQRVSEHNMCSSLFKIKIIVEYPFKTIKEQIMERQASQPIKYFSQDQMWSILYSCCHALYSLYVNKFNHECLNTDQIFIDTSGIVKIADIVLVNTTKNHLALMNEGNQSVRYISPQLVNLVEDNNFYYYQKEKSDVFILGMIILEVGMLAPIHYYNHQTKKFDFDAYIPAIRQIQTRYSKKFCQIIQKMLVMDFKERPKLEDVIGSIEQKTIQTASCGNTSDIGHDFPDFKNSFEEQKPAFVNSVTLPKNQNQNSFNPVFQTHYKPVQAQSSFSQPRPFHQPAQPISFSIKKEDPLLPLAPLVTSTYERVNPSFEKKAIPVSAVPSTPLELIPMPTFQQYVKEKTNNGPLQPQQKIEEKRNQIRLNVQKRDESSKRSENYTPYQTLNNTQQKESKRPSSIPSVQFVQKQMLNPANKPIVKPTIKIPPPPPARPLIQPVKIQESPIHLFRPSLLESPLPVRRNNGVTSTHNIKPDQIIMDEEENKFKEIELSPEKKEEQSPRSPQPKTQRSRKSGSSSRRKLQRTISISDPIGGSSFVVEDSQEGHFQGYQSSGQRNGIGRLVFPDGGYYEGKWKHDMMEGYGQLFYANGNLAYEGFWKNNQFSGQGKVYNDIPETSVQNIVVNHKDLSSIEQKWVSYQGQFLKDERNGKGTMYFVTGQKFSGTFVQDRAQGEGVFQKADGQKILGRWNNNLLCQQ